ncbi:uncharacterized protein TRIADDRAFT_52140 [Trichoplax adhaerens]|uniref:Tetraspanin n=1 Tax=Trichoplax adhaerens TaxID=10228 RepID=B3RLV9_TRIAD|nr:hypothetical protein TRIADDRAFT_52140 [Trichoplax adhaerens]EDV29592.1 hypothetical protein TRIADDRAFT_52140 [Trichoplax adhaerens]|eukprot:XP_002108794.1 hypothetical protein TRIADDRAFT_52140 [Trichoplax adhaerens]
MPRKNAVVGATMLGMGIYYHIAHTDYAVLTSESYFIGVNLLIAGGTLLFAAGFLGCFSALCDNQALLVGFILALILLLGLEIGTAIYGYVGTPTLEGIAKKHMTQDVETKFRTNVKVQKAMNNLQKTRKCCGVDTYKDYAKSSWALAKFNNSESDLKGNFPVPDSCCNTSIVGEDLPRCQKEYANGKNVSYIYADGCYPRYRDDIVQYMFSLGAVGVSMTLLQIMGIMLSFILCCSLNGSQGYGPLPLKRDPYDY